MNEIVTTQIDIRFDTWDRIKILFFGRLSVTHWVEYKYLTHGPKLEEQGSVHVPTPFDRNVVMSDSEKSQRPPLRIRAWAWVCGTIARLNPMEEGVMVPYKFEKERRLHQGPIHEHRGAMDGCPECEEEKAER